MMRWIWEESSEKLQSLRQLFQSLKGRRGMAKWNQKLHWQLQQLKKSQQSQKSAKPEPAMEPEKISAEVSSEPIVAVRVWNIAKVGGMPYLRSTFKSEFVWPYRKPIEQDVMANMGIHAIRRGLSSEPSWNNPFGGTYSLESLIASYKAEVMGEVYLWGRVQEMEWGYLAEFAYPKRLWVAPQTDVITLMQLEDEYGVPCDTHDALDKKKLEQPAYQLYPGQIYTVIPGQVTSLSYLQASYLQAMQHAQQSMLQQANALNPLGGAFNSLAGGLGSSKGLLGGL